MAIEGEHPACIPLKDHLEMKIGYEARLRDARFDSMDRALQLTVAQSATENARGRAQFSQVIAAISVLSGALGIVLSRVAP